MSENSGVVLRKVHCIIVFENRMVLGVVVTLISFLELD